MLFSKLGMGNRVKIERICGRNRPFRKGKKKGEAGRRGDRPSKVGAYGQETTAKRE